MAKVSKVAGSCVAERVLVGGGVDVAALSVAEDTAGVDMRSRGGVVADRVTMSGRTLGEGEREEGRRQLFVSTHFTFKLKRLSSN